MKKVRYPKIGELWLLLGNSPYHHDKESGPKQGTLVSVFKAPAMPFDQYQSVFETRYHNHFHEPSDWEINDLHATWGYPIHPKCWARHYSDGQLTYVGRI